MGLEGTKSGSALFNVWLVRAGGNVVQQPYRGEVVALTGIYDRDRVKVCPVEF